MTASSQPPVLMLGGASDMAVAIAQGFAQRGHPLILAGRNLEKLDRIAADLNIRTQAEVTTVAFDVLDLEGHRPFFQALDPKPHVVVCAVGLLGDQEKDAADPAAADQVMRTNFIGPSLALEAAAEMLQTIDAPTAIVGIGSVAGDRGRAKNYVYGSAKAGFAAYLSGLRQKLARTNVHVVTVKPGFVRTAMTEGMDLPGPLTSDPDHIADIVLKAVDRKKPVIYSKRWGMVMGVIKNLPEGVFMKTKF